jgi:hypothetical protein
MFNKAALEQYKKATELQLEGLRLLKQASDIMAGVPAAASEIVIGDPQPVAPVQAPAPETPAVPGAEEGVVVLALPEEVRTASLQILEKVAGILSKSEDEGQLKLALELDEIAAGIQKNAFVYEKDAEHPEPEMNKFFQDGATKVLEGQGNLPKKDMFDTDTTHAVANFVKNEAPYQKINTGK